MYAKIYFSVAIRSNLGAQWATRALVLAALVYDAQANRATDPSSLCNIIIGAERFDNAASSSIHLVAEIGVRGNHSINVADAAPLIRDRIKMAVLQLWNVDIMFSVDLTPLPWHYAGISWVRIKCRFFFPASMSFLSDTYPL
jgi:hypothetical protein